MKENEENGVIISEINAKEVSNSRKNLEVINQVTGTLSVLSTFMRYSFALRYEECDRRTKALADAYSKLCAALDALGKLQEYEEETISLCQEGGQV